MRKTPDDEMLERYLSGNMTKRERRAVDAALNRVPELSDRLERLRQEREIVESVKDSFAIRLPESEEDRIVSRAVGQLDTALDSSRPDLKPLK